MAAKATDISNATADNTGIRIAVAVTIFAGLILSASAFAENNNPGRARVTIDPATGNPVCTLVSSSDPNAPPGAVFPCPPAVLAAASNGKGISGNPGLDSAGGAQSGSGNSGPGPNASHPVAANEPVLLDGAMVGGATAVSVIRLANFGNAAGKATITFIDPATGQTLATWASQDFPAHSSTQQRLDAVSAAATLEPAASLPAVVNLAVSATFPGTVQLLIGSSGTLTDASVCGVATTAPRERIAFVPVDTSQTRSWIRLVNSGSDAQVAHLVVRNAATGASLGTWTSASVPGRGATTVALAALLTEASVADGPTGFMIDSDQLPKGLRLELSAVDATSGGIADQTVSCALSGVGG